MGWAELILLDILLVPASWARQDGRFLSWVALQDGRVFELGCTYICRPMPTFALLHDMLLNRPILVDGVAPF